MAAFSFLSHFVYLLPTPFKNGKRGKKKYLDDITPEREKGGGNLGTRGNVFACLIYIYFARDPTRNIRDPYLKYIFSIFKKY